jgi:hypothetical protein
MNKTKPAMETYHRFLDEAGDTAFYGKGKRIILGEQGVSKAFILGMVKFKEPLEPIRQKVKELQATVVNDPYYQHDTRLQKRIAKTGFYFHASIDRPEVRKTFFEFIKTVDCSLEAVVGRKIVSLYEQQHKGKETEFYADMLSHLLKNKLHHEKLVLNIAERGDSTKNKTLQRAVDIALERRAKQGMIIETTEHIALDVQTHTQEPLLNIADYLCWAVQRVFEEGDVSPYQFVKEKISLVVDLYDTEKYGSSGNYYRRGRELTAENKISPQLH